MEDYTGSIFNKEEQIYETETTTLRTAVRSYDSGLLCRLRKGQKCKG